MIKPVVITMLLGGVCVASAQMTGNPAGLSPDTPGLEAASPDASHANTQDRLFVRQISIGNRAEVDLAKLAKAKGSDAGVKDFANRMEKDHAASLQRALKAGRSTKMDLPEDIDAEHKRVRSELNALSGVAFDRAYDRADTGSPENREPSAMAAELRAECRAHSLQRRHAARRARSSRSRQARIRESDGCGRTAMKE
jgi:putative membrane protein